MIPPPTRSKLFPYTTLFRSNGAKIAGVSGYESNYWVKYTIEDVLKRLLFFSFYERFYPNKLSPAIDPFMGAITINQKPIDRKSTRLNSSHVRISYAVFCLKK